MFSSASVFDVTPYQPLPGGPEIAPEPQVGSRKRRRLDDGDACDTYARGPARLPPSAPVPVAPGALPAAAATAASAEAPAEVPLHDTMWGSFLGCLSVFRDPDYACSLGCMLAGYVGTGLLKSGYLMTIQGVGHAPLLMNEVMDGVQAFATIPAMFAAHYLVDQAAASREAHPDVPQRYLRGLAKCGVVDLALGAGLAASAMARDRGLLGEHALLGLVAVGQTIDSLKALLNFGYWRCAKLNLGSEHTRRMQRELQMQMIAVEMPFFLVISYSQSIGVYACALKYAAHRLMRAGALALAVGGVLAFVPKTWFWAKGWAIGRQRRAAAAASVC